MIGRRENTGALRLPLSVGPERGVELAAILGRTILGQVVGAVRDLPTMLEG